MIAAIFDTSFPWPLFLGALFVGGLVKGALGVGLPLVSTPLLGLGLSSYQSISLLAAPVALSNLYQAIDGGRIVGRGTHAELLATSPAYAQLVNAYETDAEGTPA